MDSMIRTYEEINEKIQSSKANVISVFEAKSVIKDKGIKYFLSNFDVVTCASFEMNTNASLYMSFGQTDPLIYFSEAYLNNVPAYPTGPTDLILSCVAFSKDKPEYGGAHIIEELVGGKDIHLKAAGKNLQVFPNKDFETWFKLDDLNCVNLFLNQAINQNDIVAANSGDVDISSHMGTLIAHLENSTYNSSSFLNPLINDPLCKTIGVGTRIWIAGGVGYVTGYGTNHNPAQRKNDSGVPVGNAVTLSAIGDLRGMQKKWIRGGYLKSFSPVLYVGVGVPIPVLDEEIANSLAITDERIHTTMFDFSIPRRTKPILGQCTYSELRTSTVSINKKPTLSAPLSSMSGAIEICNLTKESILNKTLFLSKPLEPVNMNVKQKVLNSRLPELV